MDKNAFRSRKDRLISMWALLCFALLLPTLFGCSFDKPSSPSWDVDVSIPLVSKVYTMSEIADDEDAISVDSTGLLRFAQTSELDEYLVGDQLDMEDQSDDFSLTLGSITVDSPGSESVSVALREIFPNADLLDGQTTVIPSFTFETDKKPLNSYDDFSYVLIDTGSISISIINQLAITLGAPISLEVWDTNADTLIVTITNNTLIPPGSTQTFIADLADTRLPNQLSMLMRGVSAGSNGNAVVIDAASRYEMSGEISELRASEALAKIPRQVISSTDDITITDSLVVTEAAVESGVIQLNIGGDIPLDAWLVYRLPDFYDGAGNSLVDSLFISRNGAINNTINLSGFALRPQPADFAQQKVAFDWTIKTVDTGDNFALVRSGDIMNAGFSLSGLRFSSVTGKIGMQKIDVSQEDIEFDIPADMDSIFFETAQLELTIDNGINFPARLRFNIEGRNENGGVSHLQVDEVIQPASAPGKPVKTTIILNNQNSTINEFISILPNLVKIDGSVELGDPNWIGTVSTADFVGGEVKITAPFSLRLPSQKIDSDPNNMNIDDDVKEDIIDNLANGSFVAQISNHIPIGADVRIYFGESDSTVFSNPVLTIPHQDSLSLRAEAADTDNEGYVPASQLSEISFSLSEQDMQTFLRDRLYSGVRVVIDGTHGKFVKVRASDFLEIKAYSTIRVKINQD